VSADHFDECPECGMNFHASIKAPTTLQVENGQVCLHPTPNGAWAFLHAVGGGAKPATMDIEP